MFIVDDFLINSLIVGILVAISSGVLGVFIFWKKMAYFGDSLSHSSVLGVLLGIMYGLNINIGILILCVFFICILLWMQYKQIASEDIILGVLASVSLSISVILISLNEYIQIDLHSVLFGNILSVENNDLYLMVLVSLFVVFCIWYFWSKLLLITLDKNLAKAEGVNVFLYNLLILICTALVVAISFDIVGALLITSMLILPPSISVQLSNSPILMIFYSVFIGVFCIVIGIFSSIYFDIPSGPSIIVSMGILFALISIIKSIKKV